MRIPRLLVAAAGSAALCAPAAHAATVVNAGTVNLITGPAQLDLTGDIVYAVNFSSDDPDVVLNGVTFKPDRLGIAGASFITPNQVAPWVIKPVFGDSPDQNALEQLYEDIRWADSNAGQMLEANFDVTPGQIYKVQILFYENKLNSRRWDIEVEGEVKVIQVTSNGATSPAGDVPPYATNQGCVYAYQFVAGDAVASIRMGQIAGAFEGADPNPIWQAITLERVVGDSDNDGMLDSWEVTNFGNLLRNGTGDFEPDGLTDVREYELDTNPKNADSDGDTLTDGAEVNTHFTNPKSTDSDGDTLTDGAEVNTHLTNPALADTDGDTLQDGAEINTHGTNPLKFDTDDDQYDDGWEVAKGTSPLATAAQPIFTPYARFFSGGDPGEGLDLTGTFLYAFNVGTNGAPGQIGDANFTDDTVAVVTAVNEIPNFNTAPNFGDTANDDALEVMMSSIRWTPAPGGVTVSMTGLTLARQYKLQLLFMENCCNRGFDIFVNGVQQFNDFGIRDYQGAGPTRASVFVFGFTATSTTVDISLNGAGVTRPDLTDHNATLSGVVLEAIPPGADTDGDSLPDNYEMEQFGNLTQTGAGDTDADGLNNLGEYNNVTNPNDKDTDDDGLFDGPEVNTHLSNPRVADTDGDGLTDGAEVNTHGTSPTKLDSDDDQYDDAFEIAKGTNPISAASQPLFASYARAFTGGDAGEGLDLTGNFLFAFNVGTNGAPGQIGDANFTDDSVALVSAVNEIPNFNIPNFGSTANDDALEQVMASIRWTPAPGAPTVDMEGLTVGKPYKLQLLFMEGCCDRGFDIVVNGFVRHNDFAIRDYQGLTQTRASVFVYGFVAQTTSLSIVLNGPGASRASILDRNATLSGVTLEAVDQGPDTDGDGLPDQWETANFGNLSQTAAGDGDSDGLSNLNEYRASTKPGDPDSDDDGLNDGAEVNTHHTNALEPDTEFDGVSDGAEINTHNGNPLLADTDGDFLIDGAEVAAGSLLTDFDTDNDGVGDYNEVQNGSNPASAASVPTGTYKLVITGGDDGEGADMRGNFIYAMNIGTNGAPGQIGDAMLTDDLVPGVTIIAQHEAGAFANMNFGDTPADDAMEIMMNSIRWSEGGVAPGTVDVSLANLVPGVKYKLQLFFGEGCCLNRGYDIVVENNLVANDYHSSGAQAGLTGRTGSALVHEFTAGDDTLNIILDGRGVTNPALGDHNAILSGITLEQLSDEAPPVITSITKAGGEVVVTGAVSPNKVYALDYSADLVLWSEVNDSVLSNSAGVITAKDTTPTHQTPVKGYWRLRDPVRKPTP